MTKLGNRIVPQNHTLDQYKLKNPARLGGIFLAYTKYFAHL